jgi:hypothetical protein
MPGFYRIIDPYKTEGGIYQVKRQQFPVYNLGPESFQIVELAAKIKVEG